MLIVRIRAQKVHEALKSVCGRSLVEGAVRALRYTTAFGRYTMEECQGFVARLTPFKDQPEKQRTAIDSSVMSPTTGQPLPSTMTSLDFQLDPMTSEPSSTEEMRTVIDSLREQSVAIERDRAQLALLLGDMNSKNSSLNEKIAALNFKLATAREEKNALVDITTKLEDLMWEQGSEHQAEMAEMEKAYEEVLCVRVKEAREDGVKVGIAQQSGLGPEEESGASGEASSPKSDDGGFFSELFSIGKSDSGELKTLKAQLDAQQEECSAKDEELQSFMGDRDYYESQMAQGKGELEQAQSKVRELSQEIDDYRGGAMRKQQEKEVRELNKTLSYVKKHMFNLFKSTGQERVREYMKEVFAGNWKCEPPMSLTPGANSSVSSEKLQREISVLEKRCQCLAAEKSERDDEIKAIDKELRYTEKELAKERQRVHKAEELLVNLSAKKEKKKSFWKKMTS